MKIGQPSDNSVPVNSTASQAASKGGQGVVVAEAAKTSAQSTGVAVTVSTLARTLEASKRGEAEVNVEKVKAVRSAIQQGTYVVNAEAIADKLLSNAQEMLERPTR
jgi:negative regulator of flagellin synthesis FlgM